MPETQQEQNPLRYLDISTIPRQEENILIWGLDPKEILFQIECYLRGIAYDSEVNDYILKYRPLLNNTGINTIMTILRSRLNKYITLSNLSEYDVRRMARDTRIEIVEVLYYNWQEFGLVKQDNLKQPNITDFDIIVNIIDHNVYGNLRRALDAGERNAMRTVLRFIQSIRDDKKGEEKKKGMFGNLFANS